MSLIEIKKQIMNLPTMFKKMSETYQNGKKMSETYQNGKKHE